MHTLQTRRRFLRALGGGLVAVAGRSFSSQAAEPRLPPLTAYLQRAGYYPVKLDRDDNNNLLARGRLGDRKTTFLVDTGWTFTSANRKWLRDLKTLGELGARLEDSLLGRLDWKSAYVVGKLMLGEAEFLNQPVFASTTDVGEATRWQAVLGLDFLLRNHAILDCLSGWLCVRGTEPGPAVRQAIDDTLTRSGYTGVPLTPADAFMLFCQPRLNGEPASLLIDTGAVYSVLHVDTADRLKLSRQEAVLALRGVGKIGTSQLATARLTSWEFGGAVARGVGIGVADLEPWFRSERATRKAGEEKVDGVVVDGLLGADLLYRFGAVIDCRPRRLWVDRDRMAGKSR